MINKIIGLFIKLFANIAGKDPAEWLVNIAGSAGLDQDEYNKLLETL